jgi:hypothetical protein
MSLFKVRKLLCIVVEQEVADILFFLELPGAIRDTIPSFEKLQFLVTFHHL